MNIVIFSWRGPGHPNAGGAEIVTHEHAKAWVKAGHKVTLFTSYFQGAKREEVVNGVEILRRGCQLGGVHIAAFFWYVFKNHKKYDLIIDQFHGIPFFTPLYVHKPKLAVLQEVAKDVWFLNDFPFPLNLVIGFLGYISEPIIFLLYRNVDFMVGSNSAKEDLIKEGMPSLKITIVHHGVIIKYSRPFPPKEKIKTVVFLGVLTKDKGIEDALKTFALINKQSLPLRGRSERDWQFWVVGKGDANYLSNLKFKIKNLKLDGKVKFWGYVSEKKKFELLARAWVMINPSVREGWGLVNIEANSVGTPVVAYNVPGVRDSVQDGKTGLLSKFEDYRSLANNALELCKNRDLYETFEKNAINWSKRFNWKKSGRESLKLIETICRKK